MLRRVHSPNTTKPRGANNTAEASDHNDLKRRLGGTDSHNNADIRALLTPLAAMASKRKVAIVVVTHLNKSSQANALYRASGSLAFVAAARAVFSVVKDPDDPDRRLFLPIKNNLGDDQTDFIGVVENVRLSGRQLVGTLRFAHNDKADEALVLMRRAKNCMTLRSKRPNWRLPVLNVRLSLQTST